MYVCIYFCFSSVYLSGWLAGWLAGTLSVCLSACLPVCLPVYLSTCLSACLSACMCEVCSADSCCCDTVAVSSSQRVSRTTSSCFPSLQMGLLTLHSLTSSTEESRSASSDCWHSSHSRLRTSRRHRHGRNGAIRSDSGCVFQSDSSLTSQTSLKLPLLRLRPRGWLCLLSVCPIDGGSSTSTSSKTFLKIPLPVRSLGRHCRALCRGQLAQQWHASLARTVPVALLTSVSVVSSVPSVTSRHATCG